MIPSSACQPWRADQPGNAGEHGDQCRQLHHVVGHDLLVPETDFSRAYRASALGHIGDIEGAGLIWKELKEINPKYSFEEHVGRFPFKVQADVNRIRVGLAKAGLL
jgi:hypothetical protein